jgi:hypothetical protein
MANDQRVARWKTSGHESESDTAESLKSRPRSTKGSTKGIGANKPSKRHRKKSSHRGSIASSNGTSTARGGYASDETTNVRERMSSPKNLPRLSTESTRTTSKSAQPIVVPYEQSVSPPASNSAATAAAPVSPDTLTPATPALTNQPGGTDDSDTDFQSAYSTSPRASLMEDKMKSSTRDSTEEDDFVADTSLGEYPGSKPIVYRRARNDSAATAKPTQRSPTMSEHTVIS